MVLCGVPPCLASMDGDQVYASLWTFPRLHFLHLIRVSTTTCMQHIISHVQLTLHIHYTRFITLLPAGWLFIVVAIILRISEGIGSALATTAALSLIPILHPDRISTLMVYDIH